MNLFRRVDDFMSDLLNDRPVVFALVVMTAITAFCAALVIVGIGIDTDWTFEYAEVPLTVVCVNPEGAR